MVKYESKTDKQSSLKALIYQGFPMKNGRLAQLVAHPLDVREVTSSSLVSSAIVDPEAFGLRDFLLY